LFDGLQRDHKLDVEVRRLLEYAGLLHDIGSVVRHDKHTQHSYYLIKHGGLRGLSEEEVEIVAQVARWHGKGRPKKSDTWTGALSRTGRRTVRWLAAILRVAEALDRSQYQLVRGVTVSRAGGALTLRVQARENARLEVWAARERVAYLERLLGRPVRIVLQPPAARRRR
jgi:exopolyphosphatase/guanosine-5'-triphosphate,3'-diphosphate pyrophosphatase